MGGDATLATHAWQVRVGQIETVLTFFGTLCSISVDLRPDDVRPARTVYVQAQRSEGGLEIEAIGDRYLPVGAGLDSIQVAALQGLGWSLPDGPASPNFTWFVASDEPLSDVAAIVARTLAIYGVQADQEWTVSPPEFGNQAAGFAGLEILDPEHHPEQVLREGSGVDLVVLIAGDLFSWDDLIEAGLPRGDKQAELAMVFRSDCPVEFLRKSSFHYSVLADPMLPGEVANAVLAEKPTAYELNKLRSRGDIERGQIRNAAVHGLRLARWYDRSGGEYLTLPEVPVSRLNAVAKQHDDEAVGMLRHPRCPDSIVERHLTARSARVRYCALAAVKRRNLPIDSALIRRAKTLPMVEALVAPLPYIPRALKLADTILEAR